MGVGEGHETLLNTKAHPLKVTHCGDINCDHFTVLVAFYLGYPSTLINKFSMK